VQILKESAAHFTRIIKYIAPAESMQIARCRRLCHFVVRAV